jgi:hypothetical protein
MVGKLWVVVVLLGGLVSGVVLSDLATMPDQGRPDFFRGVPYFNPDPTIRLHVVLTTVEVALLLSLVVIYLKIYAETKANFALGLVIVLGALLLQTVFSYPLVLGLEGPVLFVQGRLPTISDILTISAYTVFLYLSLE